MKRLAVYCIIVLVMSVVSQAHAQNVCGALPGPRVWGPHCDDEAPLTDYSDHDANTAFVQDLLESNPYHWLQSSTAASTYQPLLNFTPLNSANNLSDVADKPAALKTLGGLTLSARGDTRDSGLACDGATDDTANFTALASAVQTTSDILVLNCPVFLAHPLSVNLPPSMHLAAEGSGELIWNFGSVQNVLMVNFGRGYTSIPTFSITGNATLGPPVMQISTATIGGTPSGYVNGDVVTVVGGNGTPATFTLTVNNNGTVTAAVSANPGAYTNTLPPLANNVTGGSGTGLVINITFGVAMVPVATPGTYPSAVAPTISVSGGSPSLAAQAIAVGEEPVINAAVTAPQMQIFGGYARVGGTMNGGVPNGGAVQAAWFGVSSNNADNTAAMQAATDSSWVVKYPVGVFIVKCVNIYPHTKWIGEIPTATTPQQTLPAYGTLIWGTDTTGTCQGVVQGYLGVSNQDNAFQHIGISSAASSNYNWDIYLPDAQSFNLEDLELRNQGTASAGGNLGLVNEDPAQWVAGSGYTHAWTGEIRRVHATAINNGQPLLLQDTDVRIGGGSYFGNGPSTIQGGDVDISGDVMFDRGNPYCLVIEGRGTAAFYVNVNGDMFQNCVVGAIYVSNGLNPSPTAAYVSISHNIFSAMSVSSADITFNNVTNSSAVGNVFEDGSPVKIISTGTSDYLTIVGNGLNGHPAQLVGTHNTYCLNGDGTCEDNNLAFATGGTTMPFSTINGTVLQLNDPGAAPCNPFQLTPGVTGGADAVFKEGCSVPWDIQSPNTINLWAHGVNELSLGVGAVTSPVPILSQTGITVGSGSSYPIPAGITVVDLKYATTPSNTITLTFPTAPQDMWPIILECSPTIQIAEVAGSGDTLDGTAATCSPGQGHLWLYRKTGSHWMFDHRLRRGRPGRRNSSRPYGENRSIRRRRRPRAQKGASALPRVQVPTRHAEL